MRVFENERYTQLALAERDRYASAEPFHHVVIDDFLPREICERVLEEFPGPKAIKWREADRHHSKKLAMRHVEQLGPATQDLLYDLNRAPALGFLSELTGINGLIPDPGYVGGGVHQIVRGGFLKVHADFNKHPTLGLDRRINLLVYLNKDWEEEYGGHLELWDPEMKRCVKRVLPVFNRCVVFSTTDHSYHGHPDPLTCPEGRTRKSLALYYYSNGRPREDGDQQHGTLWQERPVAAGPVRRACGSVLRNLASTLDRTSRAMRRVGERWRPPRTPG